MSLLRTRQDRKALTEHAPATGDGPEGVMLGAYYDGLVLLSVTAAAGASYVAWRATRGSDERYRRLVNRSLAGFYRSTVDGRLLECNDALARILGYRSSGEVLALQAPDLYPDPAARSAWIRRLMAEKSLPDFEQRLKRRDGSAVWVVESASLVPGAHDEPPVVEGTLIDITTRKEAEDKISAMSATLQANMDRYRMLVESTSAVPWEMDGSTLALRYISPQAARLFGFDPNAMVGAPDVWAVLHADDRDRVRAEFAGLARSETPGELDTEYRIITGTGRVAHVRSVVGTHAAPGDACPILRGITLDVSAQRRLEMELQQAQKLESVGRLSAGIAHEINTPVQFVSDSLHFVQEGMQDLERVIATYRTFLALTDLEALADARLAAVQAEQGADLEYLLEHMPKALARSMGGLERVATIVRSMKEFAHPDQKEMTAVDINRAIQSTLAVARHEYKYVADLDLELADLPAVTCFGSQVNQAVLNVVVNAAHAIEERVRGTGAKGHIHVRTTRDGDAVVISVADTGGGIPEAIRTRVFDPFFTTKGVGKGTGQGLAIARSVIVDRHAGDMTFDTETGVGTTFRLRLPIAGPRPQAAA